MTLALSQSHYARVTTLNQTPNNQFIIKKSLNHRAIDRDALNVVERLHRKGFTTYFVGGCVRDLLLGIEPKDFDIATSARPNQVRQNIQNAFVIGRRFRLVLVKRGERQFEVSTFRRDPLPNEVFEDENMGDNIFGDPEADANRRDFTINSLFYDPVENEIIDYAKGMKDLNAGIVRMIGDPQLRLVEDPIRILRAIRLAHMIRFSLDTDLKRGLKDHADKLPATALPRRREEILKFLRLQDPSLAFITSFDLGVLKHISPTLDQLMHESGKCDLFLKHLREFHTNELGNPSELFAGLMHAYLLSECNGDMSSFVKAHDILDNPALQKLMRDELGMFKSEQMDFAKSIHLHTILMQRDLWEKRGERRRQAVLSNPAFELSMKLAEREFLLAPEDLMYWTQEKEKWDGIGKNRSQGSGHRNRPRRRRFKRKP